MVTISTAATVADLETTAAALRNPMCRELNPIMGRNPSRARLYATGLGIHTGLTLLTYWIKKKGVRSWWVPHLASSGMHGYAAMHNARSGCF